MPSRGYDRAIAKKVNEGVTLKAKMDAARKAKENHDTAPHLIVEARAGTGKTTTLIEALKLLKHDETTIVPSPQQRAVWNSIYLSADHAKTICFVAFNKSIATELQRRVPPGVDAMTMHSMGLKAVTALYGKVKIEQNRVSNIVESLLDGYADVWEIRRKRPGLLPLAQELVGLCKMNLLDGSEEDCYGLLEHHAINPGEDATIVPEAVGLVPQVLDLCADVEHDRCIDFDDMVWLPVKNKLAVKRYDLLLVDECQDLNRCQQALAKKAGHRLILVGDSRQAIYGFAGADSASMKRISEELNAPTIVDAEGNPSRPGDCGRNISRGCVVLPLTVTRRCGKAIVEEAKKIVPDFEAHESNGPGKISRANLNDPNNSSSAGVTTTYRKGLTYHEQCQDGDMVLCRINAPLVSECFKFLKAGRRANIQGRDIGQGLISTVKGTKADTITDLIHHLSKWISDQTAKEQAKKHPSQDKLLALNDRYDCLMCFIEGQNSVQGVLDRIASIFTDERGTGIKLSSVHKAKGLEAKRVFFIETEKTRKIMEMAKAPWQQEQEQNIRYIAITRAIEELCFVS